MEILYEKDIRKDISLLYKAWENPQTFTLLPDKSDISESWVKQGILNFPEELKFHHFILSTSGSTGEPKLVIGYRQRAENLVKVLHKIQDSSPVKQALLALPLSYCYAFVNQWLWTKVFDRKLVITGGFKDPKSFKEALINAKDGMLCLVGPQIPLFVKNFGEITFPGIIRLHFAGGLFPQHEINLIKKKFSNAKIFNNYGCAEAMPRLCLRALEESQEECNIGRPVPGVEIKTAKSDKILFRSPYRAVAYYDHNGLQIVRDEDWIPSGDCGEKIKGGYWRITGRTNEVFKRFGEKISPTRLLRTLYSQWNGQAAFYRENDPSGEEGHVLILSPNPSKNQVWGILKSLREHYPRTHWPLRLESINAFPLLPNGKININHLLKIEKKMVHWRQRL